MLRNKSYNGAYALWTMGGDKPFLGRPAQTKGGATPTKKGWSPPTEGSPPPLPQKKGGY